MLNDFKGKTAVLTGAASGFGLECARIAAARGMNLVLVDVQQDALDRAVGELEKTGARVLARRVDVADAAEMEALAADVQQRLGAPHFVFNNAGVSTKGLVWENTVADWEWVLGVNLWGVIHGVRLFVPMMLAAARTDPAYRGHVTNTASMAGLVTVPNLGVYNTSKSAVVNLSETLYQDLKLVTDQITCSVLCPYFVPTNITHSDRNRPETLAPGAMTQAQRIGQAMSAKAVTSGKVTAAAIAQKVLAAAKTGNFYIFSHEGAKALGNITSRMENMVTLKNPVDPFLNTPEVGARLRAGLRGS